MEFQNDQPLKEPTFSPKYFKFLSIISPLKVIVQKIFNRIQYPENKVFCSIIKDNLHLKSNVTLLKPGTIVYSDDKAGQGVMKQIQEKSTKSYDYVAVPDEKGLIFDFF